MHIVCFIYIVSHLFYSYFQGLVPSFPSGSSVTVLSSVATTCIPFNMFLAASMCHNSTPGQVCAYYGPLGLCFCDARL